MKHYSFIVAVENYLLRKGLVTVLNRVPGVNVVRELDHADALRERTGQLRESFLVVSQSLFSQCTDLFLSHSELIDRIILLQTDSPKKEIPEVGAVIHTGHTKKEILQTIREFLGPSPGWESPAGLTERERTIVRWVSMGLTNKQIADKLFLSTHTVITHRKNISAKLGIKSVSGLTIYAIVNNIITISEASSDGGR